MTGHFTGIADRLSSWGYVVLAVDSLGPRGITDWGLMVYAPVGMPLDHPTLEPLYAAAAEFDLSVVLHTFTVMPPYAPGGQDTWDNLWLQRSAAHPWCGMRNMAALIGSGVMDRYPTLRVGTLEAGHGWLPFWMARLDEHAKTIKAALPELAHKPSEYVTGGRYFQSIEIPEGARLTRVHYDYPDDDDVRSNVLGGDDLRLDPRDPKSADRLHQVAIGLYFCRDYEAAIEAAKLTIRAYPEYPNTYRWLAAALGQTGRIEEAKEALEKAIALAPAVFDIYVRRRVPWHRPEDHAHMLEGLRKAGLPEE
jgi:tetratricopeptide (TPR) repeat protein